MSRLNPAFKDRELGVGADGWLTRGGLHRTYVGLALLFFLSESVLWLCWQLKLEVDRLEELKLQNMKSVVQVIRVELAKYWDKCFYSQEQRDAFSPYHDGGWWLFL